MILLRMGWCHRRGQNPVPRRKGSEFQKQTRSRPSPSPSPKLLAQDDAQDGTRSDGTLLHMAQNEPCLRRDGPKSYPSFQHRDAVDVESIGMVSSWKRQAWRNKHDRVLSFGSMSELLGPPPCTRCVIKAHSRDGLIRIW